MAAEHTTSTLTAAQLIELQGALALERTRALERMAALDRTFDDIVGSSEGSPPDDEHDPEGATIGFERAQVIALKQQGEGHLAAVERALARSADGSYGTCTECGAAIPFERLLARPAAATCIRCAT